MIFSSVLQQHISKLFKVFLIYAIHTLKHTGNRDSSVTIVRVGYRMDVQSPDVPTSCTAQRPGLPASLMPSRYKDHFSSKKKKRPKRETENSSASRVKVTDPESHLSQLYLSTSSLIQSQLNVRNQFRFRRKMQPFRGVSCILLTSTWT